MEITGGSTSYVWGSALYPKLQSSVLGQLSIPVSVRGNDRPSLREGDRPRTPLRSSVELGRHDSGGGRSISPRKHVCNP